jgi:hypothetical protein
MREDIFFEKKLLIEREKERVSKWKSFIKKKIKKTLIINPRIAFTEAIKENLTFHKHTISIYGTKCMREMYYLFIDWEMMWAKLRNKK